MNTLNQTLQEKFPHLELSVLKLSEAQKDNETKRIDSEYFKKEYLENEEIILKHEWDYLGNLAKSIINFGAYSLCNYIEYVDKNDGVPFLNVGDIRENSINYENAKYIPLNTSKNILYKSLAKENQVLLTIAGSIGFAAVSYRLPPFTNSNQAIANIEILTTNPFYLSTYLNCRFGKSQMNKLTMSSVQPNLLLTQVKQIKIPLLPMDFQLEIEKLVKDSYLALEQSKALYKQAESLLYTELGLNPSNPMQGILNFDCYDNKKNHINYSIHTLKESFLKTGRLDSEYYQVKYEEIEKRIKTYTNGYCKLKDIVVSFSGGFAFSSNEYLENGDLALIRINNIKNANLDMNNAVYLNDEAISLSPKDKVKKGDILISMSGSIGLSCVVRETLHAMVNQRILKISIDGFNADVLVLLLNSVLCKLQFERIGTGGVQTNLATSDILNILIPKINPNTQDSIASHIQKSFDLRKQAKALLEEAKVKVESAISGGGGK